MEDRPDRQLHGKERRAQAFANNPLIQRRTGLPFDKVAISSAPTVTELIAGFIGVKTEAISPKANVFSSPNGNLSPDQRRDTIALFDPNITSPDALRELVEISRVSGRLKVTLRDLAMLTRHYRTGQDEFARARHSREEVISIVDHLVRGDDLKNLRYQAEKFQQIAATLKLDTHQVPSGLKSYPDDRQIAQLKQWVENMSASSVAKNPGERARELIIGLDSRWLGLNNLLTVNLLARADQPVMAYRRGQEILARLFESEELIFLPSIKVSVPVRKSREEEPDRLDVTNIEFDRIPVMLLGQTHQAVFIMGPAHSGKSTLAACLLTQMQADLGDCVRAGLIHEDEVTAASYNFDLTSPTVDAILGGQEKNRGSLRWSQPLAHQARRGLDEYLRSYNIVIVDFPGGEPDDITQILAANCGACSILVGAHGNNHLQSWEQFIVKEGLPVNQVRIITYPEGANRTSALVKYSRPEAGDKRTFLDLRVVGLDLRVKQDPAISLLSKFLLFRSLIESQLEMARYRYQLLSQAALL